jgi:hypothetical protein
LKKIFISKKFPENSIYEKIAFTKLLTKPDSKKISEKPTTSKNRITAVKIMPLDI